jgi:hypothetical protein
VFISTKSWRYYNEKEIFSGSGWALFMPKTLLELIDVNPE